MSQRANVTLQCMAQGDGGRKKTTQTQTEDTHRAPCTDPTGTAPTGSHEQTRARRRDAEPEQHASQGAYGSTTPVETHSRTRLSDWNRPRQRKVPQREVESTRKKKTVATRRSQCDSKERRGYHGMSSRSRPPRPVTGTRTALPPAPPPPPPEATARPLGATEAGVDADVVSRPSLGVDAAAPPPASPLLVSSDASHTLLAILVETTPAPPLATPACRWSRSMKLNAELRAAGKEDGG